MLKGLGNFASSVSQKLLYVVASKYLLSEIGIDYEMTQMIIKRNIIESNRVNIGQKAL